MFDSEQYLNVSGVAATINKAFDNFKPPENLLPSEYCERYVKIPAGNAKPGPVRFKNAPYQVEPLDMTVNPDCNRISLMWGAQTGKSQVQLMAMGFFIDHDPQSIMHMQPSQNDLQTWLNAKFDPMVETTPTLKEKIATPRGRDGVNNQRMKQYPGGFLMFAWAGSPKTMRGRSAPKIFPDEIDGYEATKEGSPVQLLWQRAATFGDMRLLFETSTPTIKGASNIESAFEAGDKRRWHCPCPHCGHKQHLKWAQVTWPKDDEGNHLPEKAGYACEECGALWDDTERYAAIRAGEWIAEKPFRGHASYHLPELASTFRRLKDIVLSFLEKKDSGDLQTFVNVSLAETWEEEGETVDSVGLMSRRKEYPAQVPENALVLTAGVDVQDDRLEVEVVGWCEHEQSWNIDLRIIRGDPGQQQVWDDLDAVLDSTYQHENGHQLHIAATCIDSGGHHTQQVYDYCKTRQHRRVFAIKGVGGAGRPIVSAPSKKQSGRQKRKVDLFTVGVDDAKGLIYSRLRICEEGPGYCHFPIERDEEYFAQLTAEKIVTKFVKGFPRKEWIKTRARNEALDMRVYALAALRILNPVWQSLKKKAQPAEAPKPEPKETITQKRAKAKRVQRNKKGGFVNSWR